jgi:hypothetical protein
MTNALMPQPDVGTYVAWKQSSAGLAWYLGILDRRREKTSTKRKNQISDISKACPTDWT